MAGGFVAQLAVNGVGEGGKRGTVAYWGVCGPPAARLLGGRGMAVEGVTRLAVRVDGNEWGSGRMKMTDGRWKGSVCVRSLRGWMQP